MVAMADKFVNLTVKEAKSHLFYKPTHTHVNFLTVSSRQIFFTNKISDNTDPKRKT